MLGVFDIQKQQYFVEHEQHIGRYIDTGKLTMESIVIESPTSLGKVSLRLTFDTK